VQVGVTVVWPLYEGISKSFRTGRLERELQMIQLSATRCSEGKVAPVLFFLTEHRAMKAFWGSGGIAPLILLPRH
jgi:hypothetical protein